jgi:hypothetical protein
MNKYAILRIILLLSLPILGMNEKIHKKRDKINAATKKEFDRQMEDRIKVKQHNLNRWKDSLVEIELMSNNVDVMQKQIDNIYKNYFSGTEEAECNLEEYTKYKIDNPRERLPVEVELDNIVGHIRNFNIEFDEIKKLNQK